VTWRTSFRSESLGRGNGEEVRGGSSLQSVGEREGVRYGAARWWKGGLNMVRHAG
jgi:hypothetical protein